MPVSDSFLNLWKENNLYHHELEDGIIAFSSYPTRPLDDDKNDLGIEVDFIDIGFEGKPKDYKTYSPLVIFDTKKMKVMHQLWGT